MEITLLWHHIRLRDILLSPDCIKEFGVLPPEKSIKEEGI